MGFDLKRIFQSTDPEKPLGGRYRVISQLGAGGFGQTFLANDLHLPGQPRCVVKLLKPQVSDEESLQTARRLFDTEARVLYLLGSHDQIPRLLAHFEDNEEFYLAQELIEGEPLSEELVAGQAWSEVQVIALLQDILQALAFVHQQDVIHRDIKPPNLMRRRRDGRIVLIDFGAVKQVSTQLANPKAGMTNMTISIGTQGYMPKEQLGGNPRFSSDVYAVGMIGIQALTGVHPRQLTEDPRTGEINWRDRASQVNPELADVIDQMVRYDYRSRYPTAAEALEALRSLPAELLESVPPPTPLPPASATMPLSAPPTPATATGETMPVMGVSPKPNQSVQPPSATNNALPTMPVGGANPTQPSSNPTLPKVGGQGLSQTKFLKPLPIVAGLAALCLAFFGIKAIFSSPEAGQMAASNGESVDSPAATPNSLTPEQQAAQLASQAASQRTNENYSEAIATYKQLIALESNDPEVYWGYCYSLNQMGKYPEAIAACDQALALNTDYSEAFWSKGVALELQKDYKEAVKQYDKALKINPQYAEAWHNKGIALLKMDKADKALEALEKATQLKPNFADAWANRGAALWSLKRYDDAISSLDKALQIDPENPNANDLRQQAKIKIGR
ncbi:MAG: serine/threonine-protein kinase [Coleofasciculaceae cyanobacterium]